MCLCLYVCVCTVGHSQSGLEVVPIISVAFFELLLQCFLWSLKEHFDLLENNAGELGACELEA